MKKVVSTIIAVTLVLGLASVSNVVALTFSKDTEITGFDGVAKSGGSSWAAYETWWNTQREDQEVEYMDEQGQAWDLEGMFLNGSLLSLVGGYDFKNGYESLYSGDIFIDVTGDMAYGTDKITKDVTGKTIYGDGSVNIYNNLGYDYVVKLNTDTLGKTLALTYDVYQIDATATLTSPYYRQNDTSGAWRYVSGGKKVGSGTVDYQTGLTNAQTGFLGDVTGKPGSHNALTINLDFLAPGTTFTAQYTMGCGNDDLIGKGQTPVPEPGTVMLLGLGLLGMVVAARKRLF